MELSLGLESLVFLDDNPVERGLIRRELPEVAVPELDEDPADYARTLAAAGYFESVRFSDEDRTRAEMYQGGVFVHVEEVPNPAAPPKKSKGKKK